MNTPGLQIALESAAVAAAWAVAGVMVVAAIAGSIILALEASRGIKNLLQALRARGDGKE